MLTQKDAEAIKIHSIFYCIYLMELRTQKFIWNHFCVNGPIRFLQVPFFYGSLQSE